MRVHRRRKGDERMKKVVVCVLAVVLCISLFAACSRAKVTGKYTSADGDAYDFNGHGSVTVTLHGETTEGYTYAMEGSNVLVYEPDYNHESGGETNNVLAVNGNTLTDRNGKEFTKAE